MKLILSIQAYVWRRRRLVYIIPRRHAKVIYCASYTAGGDDDYEDAVRLGGNRLIAMAKHYFFPADAIWISHGRILYVNLVSLESDLTADNGFERQLEVSEFFSRRQPEREFAKMFPEGDRFFMYMDKDIAKLILKERL